MDRDAKYCSAFNMDFSETVAYNNPLFPVYVRHGILSTYPNYSAISHWHEDLEFILVKKGEMTYNVNRADCAFGKYRHYGEQQTASLWFF